MTRRELTETQTVAGSLPAAICGDCHCQRGPGCDSEVGLSLTTGQMSDTQTKNKVNCVVRQEFILAQCSVIISPVPAISRWHPSPAELFWNAELSELYSMLQYQNT